MSNEFLPVWKDENASEYMLNAANLSAISPHILYQGKQYLTAKSGSRSNIIMSGGTTFKIIDSGIHKLFKLNSDLDFNPVNYLDTGDSLVAGKDYHIYLVMSGYEASLVVSLDATYPSGATASNSRRIGGFHTLCADVGTLQNTTHPLYGYMARDLLPQSIWDLLNRPKNCGAQGMVLDPKTGTWIDIYMQSGTGANTKSVYQGTVTKSQSYDSHSEDLLAVGKRMLFDHEFTSAAMGTIPYKAVYGSADPVTTGGKVNTDGKRIISNIGCEDMCGCYWQWIGPNPVALGSSDSWAEASPSGQGQQYSMRAVIAGSAWGGAAYSGARARGGSAARSVLYAAHSSRGCADGLSVL